MTFEESLAIATFILPNQSLFDWWSQYSGASSTTQRTTVGFEANLPRPTRLDDLSFPDGKLYPR